MSWNRRLAKRWKIGGTVLITVGLCAWAMQVISAPQYGELIKIQDFNKIKSVNHKLSPEAPPSTIESAYFQLKLPVGYRLQPTTQPVASLLYQQMLIKPSVSGSLVISIALRELPAGGLQDDSAYALRQARSEQYRITTQTTGEDVVRLVADTSSSAVVAFWPHAGYLATISISSGVSTPGSNDTHEQQAVLQALLAAWQWR